MIIIHMYVHARARTHTHTHQTNKHNFHLLLHSVISLTYSSAYSGRRSSIEKYIGDSTRTRCERRTVCIYALSNIMLSHSEFHACLE